MKKVTKVITAMVVALSLLVGGAEVASADQWCVWAESDEAEPVLTISVYHCVPAP